MVRSTITVGKSFVLFFYETLRQVFGSMFNDTFDIVSKILLQTSHSSDGGNPKISH